MKRGIGFLQLIVSALLLSACDHGSHHLAQHKFKVTNPWKENLSIDKEYVAQIHAYQHIELRAYERGYLQDILVDEGQKVDKGTALFQLMPQIMEAEYEKAKAEYRISKIEYENTRSLAAKKVVSKNELALSKAKLAKTKAELSLAKAHLDFTTIKAPFEGILGRQHERLGSLIDEGELVSTLSDISKMWVYFNVTEADYLNYIQQLKNQIKGKVKLRMANGNLFSEEGQIDTIEADFNHETGNVAFRATFSNPQGLLRHGETGNIIISEKIDNALVIPQKCTFEILDKKFVYTVDKNHIVHSKQVTISHELPHLYIVESGVEASDEIIFEGLGKVEVGKKIEYEHQSSEQVLASLTLSVK